MTVRAGSVMAVVPSRPRSVDHGGTDAIRTPPHSVEAEQAVLGGLMLDANAWDAVADIVSAADFYRRDHRLIFEAVAEVVERRGPCDAVTVSEHLERKGLSDETGGLAYLGYPGARYAERGERTQLCRDRPRASDPAAVDRGGRRDRLVGPRKQRSHGERSWSTRQSVACSRSPSAARAPARASSRSRRSCPRRSTGWTPCTRTPAR